MKIKRNKLKHRSNISKEDSVEVETTKLPFEPRENYSSHNYRIYPNIKLDIIIIKNSINLGFFFNVLRIKIRHINFIQNSRKR